MNLIAQFVPQLWLGFSSIGESPEKEARESKAAQQRSWLASVLGLFLFVRSDGCRISRSCARHVPHKAYSAPRVHYSLVFPTHKRAADDAAG